MTAMDFAKFARNFIDFYCWLTFGLMIISSALYAAGRTTSRPSDARGIGFIVSGAGMVAWYFLRPTF